MKQSLGRAIVGCLFLGLVCCYGTPAWADNPFAEDSAAGAPKETNAGKAGEGVTPITETGGSVRGSNLYAPGEYAGYVTSYGIVKATIVFKDETDKAQRVSWFKQILSEHGCKTLKIDEKAQQSGGWFSKKKWVDCTAEIEGRGFVLKEIAGYYGGNVAGNADETKASNDPALAGAAALEAQNKAAEIAILRYSFEVDKLIIERSKLGLLDVFKKGDVDKKIADLKDNKITGEKAKIAANNNQIRSSLSDLAQKAVEGKDYQRALDLIGLARDTSAKASYQAAQSYQGLKDYDKAIEKYKASGYGENAYNAIADCYHAKGDDRSALNSIYDTLKDFRNTPQELEALKKIDDWKLLSKSGTYTELPGKLTDIYLQKGLMNASSNHATAVSDYKKAVEAKAAAGGTPAQASAKILSDYAASKTQNETALASAKDAADRRFMEKRSEAKGQYDAWTVSYNRALEDARRDYTTDLNRKWRELGDAKDALDYLLKHPPVETTTTDPYNNNGNSGTDPYGSTGHSGSSGSSGTDPYGNKGSSGSTGNSGTDPYSTKGNSGSTGNSGTDPYADDDDDDDTDPYGGSSSSGSGTDPYAYAKAGTDPYEGTKEEYDRAVEEARRKVDRLQNDYTWLYNHKDTYVSDKTASARNSLDAARREWERYDLSNKASYIANDSEVKRYSSALATADQRYQTISQLAKEAGY